MVPPTGNKLTLKIAMKTLIKDFNENSQKSHGRKYRQNRLLCYKKIGDAIWKALKLNLFRIDIYIIRKENEEFSFPKTKFLFDQVGWFRAIFFNHIF